MENPSRQRAKDARRKAGVDRTIERVSTGEKLKNNVILRRHVAPNEIGGVEIDSAGGNGASASEEARRAVSDAHQKSNSTTSRVLAGRESDAAGFNSERAVGHQHQKDNSTTSRVLAAGPTDADRAVGSAHQKDNSTTSRVLAGHESDAAGRDADRAVGHQHQKDNAATARVVASHPTDNAARAIGRDHVKDATIPASKLTFSAATTQYADLKASGAEARANKYSDGAMTDHYNLRHKPIIDDGGFASRNWVNARIDTEMTQHYDLRHGTATSVATHLTGHPAIVAGVLAVAVGNHFLGWGGDFLATLLAAALVALVVALAVSWAARRSVLAAARREMEARDAALRAEMAGFKRDVVRAMGERPS